MESIIIYRDNDETKGGIYEISMESAVNFLKENLIYYIPLMISGKTYTEKKENLRTSAQNWQLSNHDFCGWSYGELATINDFFETNGRRYGLLTEFKENAIC